MKRIVCVVFLLLALHFSNQVHAQQNIRLAQNEDRTSSVSDYQQRKVQANRDVVGIVTGSVTGTYVRVGSDLADVLNNDNLRVLTMLGRGSIQNMKDILYLRGVDIGIVQSDALSYFIANNIYPNVKNKINYIAKLYNEEAHLVVRNEINSVSDLAGKKVNFGKKGSGTFVTAQTVFNGLGLNIQVTNYDQRKALSRLKSGEISAMVFVAGKPAGGVRSIKAEGQIKLLEIPYKGALLNTYLPSTFTSADYPNLIPEGQRIQTVATGAVMAVYNWPANTERYKRVRRFISSFFAKVKDFQDPSRHPKWKELNLTANVPGWNRFSAAEDVLTQYSRNPSKRKPKLSLEQKFRKFLESKGLSGAQLSHKRQQQIFAEFLQWSQNNN